MYENDTIAAIATANGMGAVSIIRVSGPHALNVAQQITKEKELKIRYANLCTLYTTQNDLIDEAIVIYFKAPYSFTGEDIVEFQCHGGFAVANILLNEILKYDDLRLANPGEFSKRAFLNDKMDLSKAQAISKIIEAKSEDAVKLLARQLKGELSDFVNKIRKDLLNMLAYTEVTIDYADEDLPVDIYEQICEKLSSIEKQLISTLEASKRREGLIDGFKVAIIGKPNVGKSSLLNKLLNYDRAIISDIAGTTRDTIEESVRIGTHVIKIIDTAGIRQSNDEIEKIGIKKSLEVVNEADLIIALFDNSRKCDNEDKDILELLNSLDNEKIIRVLNKIDLKNNFDVTLLNSYIEMSTMSDIDLLIKNIEIILDENTQTDEITLISKSQVINVEKTLENINSSKKPLEENQLEIFAYHINQSLSYLSNITKPYENDEMLDVMFGEFCLGK